MSDLSTASWTAVFGVVVFVAGQAAQRFVLEPLQDQRKTIGEIAFALLMFGNVGRVAELQASGVSTLDVAEPTEVARTLRSLAGRLQQSLYTIPAYGVWETVRVVPMRADVITAISSLTGWSNSIFQGEPGVHRDKIAAALRIARPE